MNKKFAIILSGAMWLGIGTWLLCIGLNLLVEASQVDSFIVNYYPLLDILAPVFGGLENTIIILIAAGLLIGQAKGRTALKKAAIKSIQRISQLREPLSLTQVYTPRYFALVGIMMFLGISIKFFGVPGDIRGLIDVAVGSGLITGGVFYLSHAFKCSEVGCG